MVVELLENKNGFTSSEIQISDYILEHPFSIQDMTAEELAAASYTSKSSIFRLCRKIGVESFQELKRQVEWEMLEKSRLKSLLEKEPFSAKSSLRDIVNIIPSFYDSAVSNTKLMFDYPVLQRIVKKIKDAEKLDIYASGITYTCALTAKFKFLSIGKECSVYSSLNEHYAVSTKEKKKLAMILSFTGQNPGMMRIAKFLKVQKVPMIGIGDRVEGKLCSLCDEYLELYQKELITGMEMMMPYISMTYIFDVFFASLLVHDFDRNLKDALEVKRLSEYTDLYK